MGLYFYFIKINLKYAPNSKFVLLSLLFIKKQLFSAIVLVVSNFCFPKTYEERWRERRKRRRERKRLAGRGEKQKEKTFLQFPGFYQSLMSRGGNTGFKIFMPMTVESSASEDRPRGKILMFS